MVEKLSINSEDFNKNYNNKEPQLIVLKFKSESIDLLNSFMKISEDHENSFLFESLKDGDLSGRYSVIGIKPDKILKIRKKVSKIYNGKKIAETVNKEPIEAIRYFVNNSLIKISEDIPSIASGIFGYIGYDFVANIEELPEEKIDEFNIPDCILLRPSITVVFDKKLDEILICKAVWYDDNTNADTAFNLAESELSQIKEKIKSDQIIKLKSNQKELGSIQSNFTKEQYFENVRKAREFIKAGDIFQVVPSQRLSIEFNAHPFLLYETLRRINPSPYMYYIKFGDFFIVGSSPETLVKVEKNKVTIKPIAGTRLKEKGKEEEIKEDLLSDPKELAEHLMLLDLGRNDVGRVSKVGSINVKESFQIQETSHLYHIYSTVEGDLNPEEDRVSALCAGFPAGTVTGAPKIRAMEIINEIEDRKRSIYSGAIGYFSSSGDMDTAIALRTAVIKDNKMYVQAGGGVVYDSDEEYEFNETINKAQALFSAAKEVFTKQEMK